MVLRMTEQSKTSSLNSVTTHMTVKERTSRVAAGARLRAQAWRELRPWVLFGIAVFIAIYFSVWGLLGTKKLLLIAIPVLLAMAGYDFWAKVRQVRRTWLAGAEAEEKVEDRLAVLEKRGWHVLHGILKADGNDIDHVVWGPRGIFVIETKAHRGKVGIEAGVLTFDGRMPERDAVDQVVRNTLFIKDHLKRALRQDRWVVSVICLTEAFLSNYRLDIPQRNVHVVKVERLIELLQGYEDTRPLRDDEIPRIGDALNELIATVSTGAQKPHTGA